MAEGEYESDIGECGKQGCCAALFFWAARAGGDLR